MKRRCGWAESSDALSVQYHDEEWGVPVHDDRKLFEFLILEGFQAGLSWSTILKKRNNFRIAFDTFDPVQIARYDHSKVESLLNDTGIVRNRRKVEAAIKNAQAFLRLQETQGSFDYYIWQFVGGKPIVNKWRSLKELPAQTPESEAMSRDLKKHGFSFVGPTICYAFMQAVGLVNDHETGCFRYREILSQSPCLPGNQKKE